MKKTFLLVPLAIILVMSLFLVSCEDEPELKIYKVTFLKDKGDTTPYDEKIVLEGSGITEAPKKPTKEGYDFEYWKPVDGEYAELEKEYRDAQAERDKLQDELIGRRRRSLMIKRCSWMM